MTWWLLKPLREFLSGFWAHPSILRVAYIYTHCSTEQKKGLTSAAHSSKNDIIWFCKKKLSGKCWLLILCIWVNATKNRAMNKQSLVKVQPNKPEKGSTAAFMCLIDTYLCVKMFLLSLPWCLRTPVAWVLQFMSLSTSISTYTQANNIIVGPALVAFRSVDVPITRKTLTEDKS